jgi:UDP-glucose 4-epimerase
MVKALLEAGHQPITLDNLSKGHRELLPGGAFIQGDIANDQLLDKIFQKQRVDAVMHFAAFIEVGESVAQPMKYFRNNAAATMALLDAMVRNEVKRFIFSSTAAVYGEPQYTPIDEDHPCQPTSPYGEAKRFVETMLPRLDDAHGLRFVSLRYFNAAGADPSGTIGERHQPESHLIPLVLDAAAGKRPHISIFGTDYNTPDGTCVRDYIHVNDLVSAHLLALNHLVRGGASKTFNLGNSSGYSVRQVIDTAAEVTGKSIHVIETGRRPGDPAVLVADSAKIKKELGWQPAYEDLGKIIRTAWNWTQRVMNG